MTSQVLRGGEFVPDAGYDRGPMILLTEEEWRRRSDLLRRHHRWFQAAMGAAFLSVASLVLLVMALVPEAWDDLFITAFFVLILGMSGVIIGFSRMLIRRLDGGPLMGLYERGFQYDWEEFYPYEEIDWVELRSDGLRMQLKAGPGGAAREWGPNRRVVEVLGEDGVDELRRRVRGLRA